MPRTIRPVGGRRSKRLEELFAGGVVTSQYIDETLNPYRTRPRRRRPRARQNAVAKARPQGQGRAGQGQGRVAGPRRTLRWPGRRPTNGRHGGVHEHHRARSTAS